LINGTSTNIELFGFVAVLETRFYHLCACFLLLLLFIGNSYPFHRRIQGEAKVAEVPPETFQIRFLDRWFSTQKRPLGWSFG